MLEAAIHKRWKRSPRLLALLPADRVYVGWVPNGTLPYCAITNDGDDSEQYTSSGTEIERNVIRFNVFSADLETAQKIKQEIKRAFNRQRFSTDGGEVINIQRSAGLKIRAEDGIWQLTEDYSVRLRTVAVGT